jgi:hypothetical protein
VEFTGGRPAIAPGMSVTLRFAKSSTTAQEAQACLDQQNLNKPHRGVLQELPTRSYEVDFFFDGRGYRPTPSSAATLRVLGLE